MKRNTKISITCGVMALALVAGSSFAYFSDRANTASSGVAGTVGIDLASDMKFANEVGIMNPGDKFDSSFLVTATGNKSTDIRTTIKLTSDVTMTESEDGQCEYELYHASDVEEVPGEGFKPKDGAKPIGESANALGTREFDNDKTITYTIKDYILNGVEGGETEDGAVGTEHDYDYVLLFRGDSTNAFQKSNVTVDVLVEAKQHRNTEAGWEVVAQESFTSGNINQDAVPAAE